MSSVRYVTFLYETLHLGFACLLFLCLFLPASVQFPDGQYRCITYQGRNQVGNVSLLMFAVRLLEPSLAVVIYILLHFSSGVDFGLKIFLALALLLCGFSHLCYKL